jgi:hypothetical protein
LKRHVLTPEERRRGGIRSAEMRRRRKKPLTWAEVFLQRVDVDPAKFAEMILSSGNAGAKVRALELAEAAKDARLTQHEAELEEREKVVTEPERALALQAGDVDWLEARATQGRPRARDHPAGAQ